MLSFSNLFLRAIEWRAELIMAWMTRRRSWLLVRGCPTLWDRPAGAILSDLAAKRMQACTSRCRLSDLLCASTFDTSSVLTLPPSCMIKQENALPLSLVFFVPIFSCPAFTLSFLPKRTMLPELCL